jgi:hypothetical protein
MEERIEMNPEYPKFVVGEFDKPDGTVYCFFKRTLLKSW